MNDIIPQNFNTDFHIDIMTELYKEDELEKKNFAKLSG